VFQSTEPSEGSAKETQRNSEIICDIIMLLENAIASGDSEVLCVFLTEKSACPLGCQLRPLENP
jgi:hypothetical protein